MASLPLISAPFAISATFGSTASDVQLALLANGAMVAVWQSYGGPSDVWYDVRAQALNHDATLSGGNFQVNTEPSPGRWSSAYYQAAPDVTAMPDGGYVIAYIDGRGTIGSADGVTERPVQFSQVVAQRFNADDQKVGTDGTLTVGLTAGGSPWYPVGLQVQSFGSSNFALAFDSNEFLNRTTANQDFNSGVYISGYSSTNAASQAAGGDVYSFRTVNTLRSGIQSGVLLEPQLDASGQHNGRMVALWRTTEFLADGFPYGDQLHAHILSEAGTPIGAEITIPRLARTDFSTRRGDEPYDLATLPGGGFVVVWTQRPGDNDYQAGIRDDIVFQMVNADGSLNGTVQRVHAADSRAQASPTIAAQPDGHFLIGWSEYDGSTYTLRGQLYTPNGTKDGDAFNLAPGASGTLANPQSLATSTGSYLVGYEDDGAIMGVTVDPSATPAAIPIVTVTTSGMTANGPVLTEGNDGFRPFTFTLTFDRAPTTEIRINYALGSDLGVYANNPNYDPIEADDIRWDFGGYTNSQQSGSLILDPSQFSPGQTSFDFPLLSIRGDTLAEADEFLQLRISSPDPTKAIVLGGEASLTVRIANDDSQTPIGVGLRGPSTVTEGTGDYTDYLAYEVHLDRAAAIDTIFSITGNFRPTPSPWFVSDRDFVGDAWPQWQVTIPAGQTVGTFYVSFKPDDIPELNERAIFALIDFPVGYRTGIPAEGLSAILATDIQDDDTPATPAVATTGPDFLVGTSAPDTFIAGAGNDTVGSGQGIDAVFGDEGNDFLSGGPDNDILDGGSENDVMAGGEGIDTLMGGTGNDTLMGGSENDTLNGGAGIDAADFIGARTSYQIVRTGAGYQVTDRVSGRDGQDQLSLIERAIFADASVDFTMPAVAATVSAASLKTLLEIYVGFFNRIPEASGVKYWVETLASNGGNLTAIADQFYDAGVLFSDLTGYSANMTNDAFVRTLYANVLGRSGETAPPQPDVDFWANRIVSGELSRGAVALKMISDVHQFFTNDPQFGFVASLLNNKSTVANTYAIQQGLSRLTDAENITVGMEMAAAVTPSSTAAAIALIGVNDSFV